MSEGHPPTLSGGHPLTLSLSKGRSGAEGWFDKLTMSGDIRHHERGASATMSGGHPLTLSLSKGRSGVKGWFDKLTMSGDITLSGGHPSPGGQPTHSCQDTP